MKRIILAFSLLLSSVAVCLADRGDVVFTETFTPDDMLSRWEIVDLNGGRSWEYLDGKAAYMLDWQTGLPGDDWLISEPISLKANTAYELTFYMGVLSLTESMKVAFCNSNKPDSLAQHIYADYYHVVSADSGDKAVRFVTREAGDYHLGFYAYSDPDQHRVEIDNLVITEIGPSSLPSEATDLTIKAADKGALSATISFNAPANDLAGNRLTSLKEVRLYRSDSAQPMHTFTAPTPGEALSYVDNTATEGFNTYSVISENEDGESQATEAKAYVGFDTPQAVGKVSVDLTASRGVSIKWNQPQGSVNGGYVDFSSIIYKVKRGNKTVYQGSDTSYVDDSQKDSDPQKQVKYSVTPIAGNYTGGSSTSGYIGVGKPLSLPYAESFANQKMTVAWNQDNEVADYDWEMGTSSGDEYDISPEDGDGGYLFANSRLGYAGDMSRFVSPILNFTGVKNPYLTFWFYEGRSSWYDPEYDGKIDDRMQVQYRVLGEEWKDVKDALFYQNKSIDGWVECSVLLPQCDGKDLNIGLLAISDADFSANQNIAVDNITIAEAPYSHDVSCSNIAVNSKRVSVDDEFIISVTATNCMADADEATVRLFLNGEEYASESLVIDGFSDAVVNFQRKATYRDTYADEMRWQAVVESEDDEVESNNKSDYLLTSVRTADVPVVTGVKGNCDGESNIHISWDEASSVEPHEKGEAVTVMDDFESYEPFIIDGIGDWTTIDADGASTMITGRIPVSYPHQGEPMAFQVFDVEQSGVWTEDNYDDAFMPLEGSKRYLACPSVDYPAENDDWLITPRLDGRAHTISFMASAATYDAEWINVYYSTTDKNPDSFVKLNDGDQLYVHDGWREYSFEVPDGAKYFAVRCVRRSVFLFVDNFKYNAFDGIDDARTLLGYNIYRDGEKLNDELLTSAEYVDANMPHGEYRYNVTAVFDLGESALSDDFVIDFTDGISVPVESTHSDGIYNLQGQRVSKSYHGIVIKNGKKVMN